MLLSHTSHHSELPVTVIIVLGFLMLSVWTILTTLMLIIGNTLLSGYKNASLPTWFLWLGLAPILFFIWARYMGEVKISRTGVIMSVMIAIPIIIIAITLSR